MAHKPKSCGSAPDSRYVSGLRGLASASTYGFLYFQSSSLLSSSVGQTRFRKARIRTTTPSTSAESYLPLDTRVPWARSTSV
ncbi:hypothetical protein AcW1_003038 [Taiwanofungus camphoratus]|nr:hypothetical protein AcW1_003038 [Antrodia cinnamomea]